MNLLQWRQRKKQNRKSEYREFTVRGFSVISINKTVAFFERLR